MTVDETIEIPAGEVEVELDDFQELWLRVRMPGGIAERCENGNITSEDISWLNQVAKTATDVDPSAISKKEVFYIVDCTARFMANEDVDTKTYDEFIGSGEETNFITEGTLGVNNE